MWLLLEDAHVSIVADPSNPRRATIRSRHADHINNLFPDAEVWVIGDHEFHDDPANDYRYRAIISKDQLKHVLSERVDQLGFGTFRERIKDPIYYDAVNKARFWLRMLDASLPRSFFEDD